LRLAKVFKFLEQKEKAAKLTMNRLGCCGLNCEECPVFTATVKNDNKLRQATAVEWSKLYAGFLKKPLELSGHEL
jgi:hypothetical protein